MRNSRSDFFSDPLTKGRVQLAVGEAVPVPGWRLNFAAGFVPLVAGLTTLVTGWVGVAHRDDPLWTGLGHLSFSYSQLAGAGPDAAVWLQLNSSVGGVNIVAAAVAVIVVSRFGLREGRRWAWWLLAFCLVWVGLHDAAMATRFTAATGQPIVVLPYTYVTLMAVGLWRSRAVVFGPILGRVRAGSQPEVLLS